MSLSCPSFIADIAPSMCRAVDYYCERTSQALDAEPLNAVSNIAFLVGAVAAWQLQSRHMNSVQNVPIRLLTVLMVVVGTGSLVFHTAGTKWAEWADIVPILIFMAIGLSTILHAFFNWGYLLRIPAVVLFFTATCWLALESTMEGLLRVLPRPLAEGAMYFPTLILLLVVAAFLMSRSGNAARMFLIAACLFVVSFTMRSIDHPICNLLPIGTHYFWHIFNASVLYLIIRAIILNRQEIENSP